MQTGDTGGRASFLKLEERSILQNKTGHDKITDFKLKESGDHDNFALQVCQIKAAKQI